MDNRVFDEYLIDAKLHIKTTGRIDDFSDDHVYPYEPTSYSVLDRLAQIDEVMFEDEIDCTDLFSEKDGRNRVLVYSI